MFTVLSIQAAPCTRRRCARPPHDNLRNVDFCRQRLLHQPGYRWRRSARPCHCTRRRSTSWYGPTSSRRGRDPAVPCNRSGHRPVRYATSSLSSLRSLLAVLRDVSDEERSLQHLDWNTSSLSRTCVWRRVRFTNQRCLGLPPRRRRPRFSVNHPLAEQGQSLAEPTIKGSHRHGGAHDEVKKCRGLSSSTPVVKMRAITDVGVHDVRIPRSVKPADARR